MVLFGDVVVFTTYDLGMREMLDVFVEVLLTRQVFAMSDTEGLSMVTIVGSLSMTTIYQQAVEGVILAG